MFAKQIQFLIYILEPENETGDAKTWGAKPDKLKPENAPPIQAVFKCPLWTCLSSRHLWNFIQAVLNKGNVVIEYLNPNIRIENVLKHEKPNQRKKS